MKAAWQFGRNGVSHEVRLTGMPLLNRSAFEMFPYTEGQVSQSTLRRSASLVEVFRGIYYSGRRRVLLDFGFDRRM